MSSGEVAPPQSLCMSLDMTSGVWFATLSISPSSHVSVCCGTLLVARWGESSLLESSQKIQYMYRDCFKETQ